MIINVSEPFLIDFYNDDPDIKVVSFLVFWNNEGLPTLDLLDSRRLLFLTFQHSLFCVDKCISFIRILFLSNFRFLCLYFLIAFPRLKLFLDFLPGVLLCEDMWSGDALFTYSLIDVFRGIRLPSCVKSRLAIFSKPRLPLCNLMQLRHSHSHLGFSFLDASRC